TSLPSDENPTPMANTGGAVLSGYVEVSIGHTNRLTSCWESRSARRTGAPLRSSCCSEWGAREELVSGGSKEGGRHLRKNSALLLDKQSERKHLTVTTLTSSNPEKNKNGHKFAFTEQTEGRLSLKIAAGRRVSDHQLCM
ncbi:unnamed protein product, partial [Ectocarpus sp. 8 AP-2014]